MDKISKKLFFKKIMLAFDNRPHSMDALDWATEISVLTGAELVIRIVREEKPSSLLRKLIPLSNDHHHQWELKTHNRLMEIVKDTRNKGIRCNYKILKGKKGIHQKIVSECKKEGCQLVVSGIGGYSSGKGTFPGSVFTRILYHSRVPLLAVPENAGPARFKKFLVPVDFSRKSIKSVKLAMKISMYTGSHITLLHVLKLPFKKQADIYDEEIRKVMDKNFQKITRKLGKHVEVNHMYRISDNSSIAREIVNEAETGDYSMIIMTKNSRHTPFSRLWGSTTERVLKETFVPVCITL